MKTSFQSAFIVLLGTCFLAGFYSCANIIPPSGGYRDSLPPRLVLSSPKDSAVNVSRLTKNIVLTFDEFVTLQNPQQSVIMSPLPPQNRMPQFEYKLRNVTIRLKDTLEAGTTYSFQFGESIKDVNEGNIARNLNYAFSTGSFLDDRTYRGKVLQAENGKPDSTLIVILHSNLDDSAVKKTSPRYFTRINGKGEFIFRNLPAGTFHVYVIPNNYLKRYDDSTQLFAFRNTPVTIGSASPRDTFYVFQAVRPGPAPAYKSSSAIKPGTVQADKRLRYNADLENGMQDLLTPLTLTFNHRLTVFDSTKITLNDTSYRPLSGYTVKIDTGKNKLTIQYNWKEKQSFRLLLEKEMGADSAGTQLAKKDTVRFSTKSESDYGSVRIRFPGLDLSRNPVLQFVQNDKILEAVPLTQNEFQRKRFRPGTYEMRILYDTNKNGVWDTGSFTGTKKQPEIVFLIPRQLAVRANWDNEVDINL